MLFLGHESIAAIMTSRLKNLSVVARFWGDGDIKVSKTSLEFHLSDISEIQNKCFWTHSYVRLCKHNCVHVLKFIIIVIIIVIIIIIGHQSTRPLYSCWSFAGCEANSWLRFRGWSSAFANPPPGSLTRGGPFSCYPLVSIWEQLSSNLPALFGWRTLFWSKDDKYFFVIEKKYNESIFLILFRMQYKFQSTWMIKLC